MISNQLQQDGRIINKQEYKTSEKNSCFKSFDGIIESDYFNGFIFAKNVFGSGGHQDNVFEEAYTFCEWIVAYGSDHTFDQKPLTYVLLIETDLDEINIIIANHVEFQQYIIDNFSLYLVEDQIYYYAIS